MLTFAAGTPDEALYCTSDAAGSAGAFLAFAEAGPAERLATTLTLTAGAGPCAVQATPPLALLLLGRECGCSVEVVLPGVSWAPPPLVRNDLAPPEPSATEPLAAARRQAAQAVRSALVRPLSALLPAVRAAAGAPGGADGEDALPAAPSALRSALRGLMRARLEKLLPE